MSALEPELLRFIAFGEDRGVVDLGARGPSEALRTRIQAKVAAAHPELLARLDPADSAPEARAFVLAACVRAPEGPLRDAARARVAELCGPRGDDVLRLARHLHELGGWGRGVRGAVGRWYVEATLEDLVNAGLRTTPVPGWTHRDVLRLTHPRTEDASRNAILGWLATPPNTPPAPDVGPPRLRAVRAAGLAARPDEVVDLLGAHALPPAVVPERLRADPAVRAALARFAPLASLAPEVGRWAQADLPPEVLDALSIRAEAEGAPESAPHLLSIAAALEGRAPEFAARARRGAQAGLREAHHGGSTWLALDISGTMARRPARGDEGTTCAAAARALARVVGSGPTDRVFGFTADGWTDAPDPRGRAAGLTELTECGLSSDAELDHTLERLRLGAVDPTLPLRRAAHVGAEVHSFVVVSTEFAPEDRARARAARAAYTAATGHPTRLALVGLGAASVSGGPDREADALSVSGARRDLSDLIRRWSRRVDEAPD